MTETHLPARSLWRSAGALFIGFLAVVALSLGTDQLMHLLNIYPPWSEPMNETSDNLLRWLIVVFMAQWAAISPPGLRRAIQCGMP